MTMVDVAELANGSVAVTVIISPGTTLEHENLTGALEYGATAGELTEEQTVADPEGGVNTMFAVGLATSATSPVL